MVDVECTTARPGGVTLVAVRLDNRVEAPGVDAHRVRLVPRVDGPVWPPRVEGVPAGPWDCEGEDGEDGDDAVEVVVPTGRVGSVGFASPAEPAEPPVEVETVEPAEDERDVDPSPEDVLRVLGDPTPPRDAVDVADRATDSAAATANAEPDSSAPSSGQGASDCRPGGGP